MSCAQRTKLLISGLATPSLAAARCSSFASPACSC